ncbi:hypothetical protein SLS64_008198 [Diaporthe eres]
MASAAAAKRLEGKTVVITGASSGIGRSTAFEFARTAPQNNLKLILTARRVDTLNQIAADIKKEVGEGVKVLPVKLDVSNPEEVRQFVPNLPAEFKDIHVLVNNAGLVKGMAKAPEIAEEDVNVMFATNVTGLINMTQAILPIFKQRPNGGAGDIINIGSIAGREPYPGGSIYCATKAAVRSFTDALRKELLATRIRVIGIDPGQVETEFSVVRFYGDKAKADAVYAGVDPLTPDDIAEVIVFSATRRENVVIADTLIFPSHQLLMVFRAAIYFDGYLPASKNDVRLGRVVESSTASNKYFLSTKSGIARDGDARPSPRQAYPRIPVPAFTVPAILEALRTSERYGHLTHLVPGEADSFCADHVNRGGGALLTSDSDLLLYDLGQHGSVVFLSDIELITEESEKPLVLTYSQHAICERLSLEPGQQAMLSLAFEMERDPYQKIASWAAQSKKKHSANTYPAEYADFISEYVKAGPSALRWVMFCLRQEIVHASEQGKESLVKELLRRASKSKGKLDPGSWNTVHLTAQIQGTLYSLRILYQTLQCLGGPLVTIAWPQLPVAKLVDCLSTLPSIEDYPSITYVAGMYGRLKDAGMLKDLSDITGLSGPVPSEGIGRTSERMKRRASKQEQRKARPLPSANPFDALGPCS